MQGYAQIVKLLLKHGANVNQSSNSGDTPFLIAEEKGNIEIVKTLLDNGATIIDRELPEYYSKNEKKIIKLNKEVVAKFILNRKEDEYEQKYYSGADPTDQPTGKFGKIHEDAVNRARLLSLMHILKNTNPRVLERCAF